ncbi:hypothetical protein RFI_08133 [Reticulomyxa filosa]|uniref:Uncharacterized protein n=1 Tax=Reticulomyxa filosa TaxID=46433 RepID=X6NTC3_RETFI|nr:hypothetical protein RFI_08133 [Reticulomyxa filosa]|eukprot:ETO28994.1 hypothetical protein RFI_08133 [Reticulomyxa filosa]
MRWWRNERLVLLAVASASVLRLFFFFLFSYGDVVVYDGTNGAIVVTFAYPATTPGDVTGLVWRTCSNHFSPKRRSQVNENGNNNGNGNSNSNSNGNVKSPNQWVEILMLMKSGLVVRRAISLQWKHNEDTAEYVEQLNRFSQLQYPDPVITKWWYDGIDHLNHIFAVSCQPEHLTDTKATQNGFY